MRQEYYLKATGSTCYNKTGITFPICIVIDLVKLLKSYGVTNIEWRRQFDWSNQPEVLTFNIEYSKKLSSDVYNFGLLVSDIW